MDYIGRRPGVRIHGSLPHQINEFVPAKHDEEMPGNSVNGVRLLAGNGQLWLALSGALLLPLIDLRDRRYCQPAWPLGTLDAADNQSGSLQHRDPKIRYRRQCGGAWRSPQPCSALSTGPSSLPLSVR